MKTIKSIISSLSFIAVMFTMSFTSASAADGFVYDVKYDANNVMVSKTVFEKSDDDNTINPKLKYEYKYNEKGDMVEKVALRWNSSSRKWDNYYHHQFSYNATDNSITVEYAMWDKRKKEFCAKKESKVYTTEEAKKLMATTRVGTANSTLAIK